MKAISSFDLHYIIKELSILLNARADKIFQPVKNELLFQFHVPNLGKRIVKVLDLAPGNHKLKWQVKNHKNAENKYITHRKDFEISPTDLWVQIEIVGDKAKINES